MQVKKQQLEPDMEKWTVSKSGREYIKAVYCHPAYLTYIQSTLHHEKRWAGRSSSWNQDCLRYAEDTTLIAESRGTKELLDESERGECKSYFNIQ